MRQILKKAYRRYLLDAMSAMALGLFASLIIGLILSQFGKIHGLGFLSQFGEVVSASSPVVGAAIGVAIAWALHAALPVNQLMASNVVFYYFYGMFLPYFVLINLFLMFFNLLPIPPLDGSSIFAFFCPTKYLPTYYKIQQYALPIFLVLVIVVPQFLRVDPIGLYLNATALNLFSVIFPVY